MDHGYFEDRISAYRDKGLPADEYELIRQHLAECESCRKLYDRLERFDRLVRDNSELGDDLYWEKAAQKIEQRLGIAETVVTPVAKKSTWAGLGWKVTAAAASLVLIVIIGLNKDKIFNEKEMMSPVPQETRPAVTDTAVPPAQVTPKAPPSVTQETEPETEPVPEVDIDEATDEGQPAESGRMRPVPTDMAVKKTVTKEEPATVTETRRKSEPTISTESRNIQPQSISGSTAPSSARPYGGDVAVEPQESIQRSVPSITAMRESPVGTAAVPQPDVVADSVVTVDTVDRVRMAELESWRAIKDSMETLVFATKKAKGIADYSLAPSSLQQKGRRGTVAEAAVDPAVARELRYVEACYQIARLATEPSEIQSAKDRLREVADNPESANRDTARVLLDRLAAGK